MISNYKKKKKMVGFKEIKYCRICKKKYFIHKGEPKRNYCKECLEKLRAHSEQKEDEDDS